MNELGSKAWKVFGRVQGVGFRYFVVSEARKLMLTGWTANLSDGSVEVQARGTVEALEKLEASLRIGPSHSRVERVTTLENVDNLEKVTSFNIRYASALWPVN